jgi:MoxR-like ATPase
MKQRINRILYALNESLYEREEVIQLSLLTTIAGESIFLLGLPGVAKSLVARRIKEIFRDGSSFEYLMNRFSTPDEIFGPIAISKLKNEDKYERIIENYLPTADIVFLDEIWKAGPSIQNALLTVINEKVYRNGHQEVRVPLKGLISASNELPAKGEGLGALWDRFIIRYLVENITDPKKFNDFLAAKNIGFEVRLEEADLITDAEYEVWQEEISNVSISAEALNVINVVRSYLAKHNEKTTTRQPIYVSDRRWKKIVRVLKTSAFLNDRKEIDLMDCFLIAHMIWDEVEQIEVVKGFVTDAVKLHGYSLKYNLSHFTGEIQDLKLDIKDQTKIKKSVTYYEPKVHKIGNETCYKIVDSQFNDSYTSGVLSYMTKSDYDALNKSKYQTLRLKSNRGVVGYHSEFEGKLDLPLGVKIRKRFHYGGSSSQTGVRYKIDGDKRKKTEVETIRPHAAIVKAWDEKIDRIVAEVDRVVKEVEVFKNENLKDLKENVFVNKQLAEIVEYNLNHTIRTFTTEKTKATKMKKTYEDL